MAEKTGQEIKEIGSYILIINQGYSQYSINRYPTEEKLLRAIQDGESYGSRFLIAHELQLLTIQRADE